MVFQEKNSGAEKIQSVFKFFLALALDIHFPFGYHLLSR